LGDFRRFTDEERLEQYFADLRRLIPNPPKNWEKNVRPCKWEAILKERQNNNGRKEETSGTVRKHSRKARKDRSGQQREDA